MNNLYSKNSEIPQTAFNSENAEHLIAERLDRCNLYSVNARTTIDIKRKISQRESSITDRRYRDLVVSSKKIRTYKTSQNFGKYLPPFAQVSPNNDLFVLDKVIESIWYTGCLGVEGLEPLQKGKKLTALPNDNVPRNEGLPMYKYYIQEMEATAFQQPLA
ncbi:hypothetical protein TNIN_445691 [Trichonephila inaurata madagascariensis]|uniref:Uncharacterized protein n=1 Tax=Trichonephila inaurata madagascariensis TaxID=2747483 RepID=A0A8X7C330_9ARAC|nr:hypothetical protein TNIN_445691 [Trichonephila inaurata madagascariensis]